MLFFAAAAAAAELHVAAAHSAAVSEESTCSSPPAAACPSLSPADAAILAASSPPRSSDIACSLSAAAAAVDSQAALSYCYTPLVPVDDNCIRAALVSSPSQPESAAAAAADVSLFSALGAGAALSGTSPSRLPTVASPKASALFDDSHPLSPASLSRPSSSVNAEERWTTSRCCCSHCCSQKDPRIRSFFAFRLNILLQPQQHLLLFLLLLSLLFLFVLQSSRCAAAPRLLAVHHSPSLLFLLGRQYTRARRRCALGATPTASTASAAAAVAPTAPTTATAPTAETPTATAATVITTTAASARAAGVNSVSAANAVEIATTQRALWFSGAAGSAAAAKAQRAFSPRATAGESVGTGETSAETQAAAVLCVKRRAVFPRRVGLVAAVLEVLEANVLRRAINKREATDFVRFVLFLSSGPSSCCDSSSSLSAEAGGKSLFQSSSPAAAPQRHAFIAAAAAAAAPADVVSTAGAAGHPLTRYGVPSKSQRHAFPPTCVLRASRNRLAAAAAAVSSTAFTTASLAFFSSSPLLCGAAPPGHLHPRLNSSRLSAARVPGSAAAATSPSAASPAVCCSRSSRLFVAAAAAATPGAAVVKPPSAVSPRNCSEGGAVSGTAKPLAAAAPARTPAAAAWVTAAHWPSHAAAVAAAAGARPASAAAAVRRFRVSAGALRTAEHRASSSLLVVVVGKGRQSLVAAAAAAVWGPSLRVIAADIQRERACGEKNKVFSYQTYSTGRNVETVTASTHCRAAAVGVAGEPSSSSETYTVNIYYHSQEQQEHRQQQQQNSFCTSGSAEPAAAAEALTAAPEVLAATGTSRDFAEVGEVERSCREKRKGIRFAKDRGSNSSRESSSSSRSGDTSATRNDARRLKEALQCLLWEANINEEINFELLPIEEDAPAPAVATRITREAQASEQQKQHEQAFFGPAGVHVEIVSSERGLLFAACIFSVADAAAAADAVAGRSLRRAEYFAALRMLQRAMRETGGDTREAAAAAEEDGSTAAFLENTRRSLPLKKGLLVSDVFNKQAALLLKQRRFYEALHRIVQALEAAPDNAEAWVSLTHVYRGLRRFWEARAALKIASHLDASLLQEQQQLQLLLLALDHALNNAADDVANLQANLPTCEVAMLKMPSGLVINGNDASLGGCHVAYVAEDSKAERLGLLPGDQIVAVNQEVLLGKPLSVCLRALSFPQKRTQRTSRVPQLRVLLHRGCITDLYAERAYLYLKTHGRLAEIFDSVNPQEYRFHDASEGNALALGRRHVGKLYVNRATGRRATVDDYVGREAWRE